MIVTKKLILNLLLLYFNISMLDNTIFRKHYVHILCIFEKKLHNV